MAYRRRILHYSSDCHTLRQVLSDEQASDPRAISAWFELHRIGGCGAAEVTLKDKFTLRGDIDINDYIAFEYDAGQRWYFGRVEEVAEESPKGVRITLYGQWSELSEVYPGGYGDSGVGTPVRIARSDWFPRDPDHALQAWFTADQPQEVVDILWTYYIAPATCVGIKRVESPTPAVGLDSFTFRGEESAAEILRSLAQIAKSASVGVDENGTLFFLQKRATILDTFQEGVDIEQLEVLRDKSLLYNGLLITGDNIYTPANIGVYRYRSFWWQYASKQRYGLRVAKAYVPWIRRHADAKRFADEFFRQYAQPTTRVRFRTNCRSRLLKPWDGQLRVREADGSNIIVNQFDSVRVNFDHCPVYEITVGPEDIQFPRTQEDQRREIPESAGDGEGSNSASLSSLQSFSGTYPFSISLTASESFPSSLSLSAGESGTVRCFTRIARVAQVQNASGETSWIDAQEILAYDEVEASASPAADGGSGYLIGRDFGFTTAEVPDSATVVGVILEAVVRATLDNGATDFVQDEQIRLFIPGTGIAGDNNATETHWPTTAAWRSWGNSLYTWGIPASLTPANVRNPLFGGAIKIATTGPTENTAYVDVMQMTVCVMYNTSSAESSLGDDRCLGGYDTFNDAEGTLLADHAPDVDTGGDAWPTVTGGLVISDPGDGAVALRLPGDGTGTGTATKSWADGNVRITLGCNLGDIGSGTRTFGILGRHNGSNSYVSLEYTCGGGGGNGTLLLTVTVAGSVVASDSATVTVPAYETPFDLILQMVDDTYEGWVNKSPTEAPDVKLVVQGLSELMDHGLELEVDASFTGNVVPHIEYYCIDPVADVSSSAEGGGLGECSGGGDTFNGPPMALVSHVPDNDTGGDAWTTDTDLLLVISDPGTSKWALMIEDEGGAAATQYASKSWGAATYDCRITMTCSFGSERDASDTMQVYGRVVGTLTGGATSYVSLTVSHKDADEDSVALRVDGTIVASADIAKIAPNAYFDVILQMEGTSLKGWVNAAPSGVPTVQATNGDTAEASYRHGLGFTSVTKDVYSHVEEYCVELLGAGGEACSSYFDDDFGDTIAEASGISLSAHTISPTNGGSLTWSATALGFTASLDNTDHVAANNGSPSVTLQTNGSGQLYTNGGTLTNYEGIVHKLEGVPNDFIAKLSLLVGSGSNNFIYQYQAGFAFGIESSTKWYAVTLNPVGGGNCQFRVVRSTGVGNATETLKEYDTGGNQGGTIGVWVRNGVAKIAFDAGQSVPLNALNDSSEADYPNITPGETWEITGVPDGGCGLILWNQFDNNQNDDGPFYASGSVFEELCITNVPGMMPPWEVAP